MLHYNTKNKIVNEIWKEVLKHWTRYRTKIAKFTEIEQLPNTVIWFSDLIKNNDLLIRRNEFIDKGLVYFKDLFDYEHNIFFNTTSIQTKYQIKINFLEHLNIIHPLSKDQKEEIESYAGNIEEVNVLIKEICRRETNSRHIYNKIITSYWTPACCQRKWAEFFSSEYDEQDWKKIYLTAKHISNDFQIRMFQYKIIHRILPTNYLLHVYGVRADPFCADCENTVDDLPHAFHQCPIVFNLWTALAHFLNPTLDIFPYINTENIILGIYQNDTALINTIFVLTKRYIFLCKCKNKQVNLRSLLLFINYHRTIEINSLCQNQKRKNENKWSLLNNIWPTV